MNRVFWASRHFFALIGFTGFWWLGVDQVWRLTRVRTRRLNLTVLTAWVVVVVVILWGFLIGC